MDGIRPTYRFKTNIPTEVFFESDEPKTGSGKFGDWYRYEVMINGQDFVIFASKGLQDKLSRLGHLYGRTLEITKKESTDNRIFWEIKEEGNLLTPDTANFSAGATTEAATSQPPSGVDERVRILERRLNTASSVVKELIDRVQSLENEVESIKERTSVREEAGFLTSEQEK